ncbi:MAG: DUF222 domain-containing protein [Candidatus Palauibacterales bacterium]|nr:DUF222 domain-containing protein [Candidatus Palauibacterales bacterium]MDP2584425.1 DUF222 domain-containing protein [Candidatus Palauibacterales bacterium]
MGATVLALREVAEVEYGERGRAAGDVSAGTSPDPDLLDELGDEIATLAAHIHAATHRMLTLIARFDRLGGWEAAGHRGCAEWLAWRTGMDPHTAREHVRVARALEELPETSASMSRGRLSFSKVRALTRVADPENEADLLELAEGVTAARLERVVRAWKRGSRQDEAARAEEIHRLRRLSVFPDEEGMYVIRGRLEPEVGALLMRAIEAASDALYREERARASGTDAAGDVSAEPPDHVPAGTCRTEPDTGREPARRRADALGLLAERALAAGFGTRGEDEAADGSGASASEHPISGTRAERYQVFLHVDADTLSEDRESGRSELEDGPRVSAETSRRLACDAALIRVTHGPAHDLGDGSVPGAPAPAGSVLSVGRRTRTIPPALRRALEVRDRGCRFPGCGLRFTDAHHVEHWADGGETSLDNCVLLCRYHHRLVHEGGWRLEWWGTGRAVFRDPRGGVHLDAEREEGLSRRARDGGPRSPAPDAQLSTLVRANRLHGADPGPLTASAHWKCERDIPDDVWFRATEAGL